MGMFDRIICEYPLPGNPPFGPEHEYQTKDLDCDLWTYHIRADGTFDYRADFTGELEFYGSNIRGGAPCEGGYWHFTDNGEDAICVSYVAVFVYGKLDKITEVARTVEPALPWSRWNEKPLPPKQPAGEVTP